MVASDEIGDIEVAVEGVRAKLLLLLEFMAFCMGFWIRTSLMSLNDRLLLWDKFEPPWFTSIFAPLFNARLVGWLGIMFVWLVIKDGNDDEDVDVERWFWCDCWFW